MCNTSQPSSRAFGIRAHHQQKYTGPQLGFIAQEVQKVLPEVVEENDKGLLQVSYGNITALIVEAIKELDKEQSGEIAKAEKKIELLEKKIDENNREIDEVISSIKKLMGK